MRSDITPLPVVVTLTRVYYQLEAGLKTRVNDVFVLLCWALVNSVPEAFARDGPIDVVRMAASFTDPERGSSTTLPEQLSVWDLLTLRFHAEYLRKLLGEM